MSFQTQDAPNGVTHYMYMSSTVKQDTARKCKFVKTYAYHFIHEVDNTRESSRLACQGLGKRACRDETFICGSSLTPKTQDPSEPSSSLSSAVGASFGGLRLSPIAKHLSTSIIISPTTPTHRHDHGPATPLNLLHGQTCPSLYDAMHTCEREAAPLFPSPCLHHRRPRISVRSSTGGNLASMLERISNV